MKKIVSLEQYRSFVQAVKDRFGKIKTNSYMFEETVERYISLGRLFYEVSEKGILMYSDEETYYRGYYFIPEGTYLSVMPKEKPVVLRILYRNGRRDEQTAENLEQAGFKRQGTLLHMKLDAGRAMTQYEKIVERTMRFLSQSGFSVGKAKKEQLGDILAFFRTISEIPFYQMSYYTEEEYEKALEKGMFYCITDKEGAVCAAQQFIEEGRALYGWAGVDKRYRGMYGMIIPLSYFRWKFAVEQGKKVMGWVEETNISSLEYHDRQGWERTGKRADEWIR